MATEFLPTRIEARPEYASILRDTDRFGTGDTEDSADRLNMWFDRLMTQSGLAIQPSQLLMFCLLFGAFGGLLLLVIQDNLVGMGIGAFAGGFAPIAYAVFQRGRRQSTMLRQLPDMVEELARASRTGRSLEQCYQMVAQDTPSPLGDEMRASARKLQMGMSLKDAMADLPERSGLLSLNILTMALSVHQQTGGDLVTVLERLSRTIRDRILFLGRLRAATAASRATAIFMIALPPGILAFFVLRDPNYLTNLMSSTWGRNSTILAITLQIIGSLWVRRIMTQSART
ncbi:MAG: type II secretion system F family protein [Planctomycetota bacterium]|nr:type II secretion system F family protein [Planctomycetota bacterium]